MIPPPAPACRRQATKLKRLDNIGGMNTMINFVTAAHEPSATSRREAQVVG